jgi:D-glycero-D-manno-heptose 1,7-bisphosphate phosphatase
MAGKRHAVFLDRDGTINVEKEYLHKVEDFKFIDGAPGAIRALKRAGYLVIVVTNQSGVARGYYSLDDVANLHEYIQGELAKSGSAIDAFYVCPHHPTEGTGEYRRECDCRKGAPGMLLQAARDHNIDLSRSFMVGDKVADIEAAENAGCKPIMVLTGYGQSEAHKLVSESAKLVKESNELVKGRAIICEDIVAAVKEVLHVDNKDVEME